MSVCLSLLQPTYVSVYPYHPPLSIYLSPSLPSPSACLLLCLPVPLNMKVLLGLVSGFLGMSAETSDVMCGEGRAGASQLEGRGEMKGGEDTGTQRAKEKED
ncbi:hypothetical protein E2C01_091499 [Portunus trituberculatus]|uniref:Uncharacterized protein n=1 Tax=Portunus trituberculatus TaxID=210409 RepID=A0A5B7JE37_PORTR|nr:hypothetical protein [Portunus trituberculatus]